MAGMAVLRMVVSTDCMKNATATSHGTRRVTVSLGRLVSVTRRDDMRASLTMRRCMAQTPSAPCYGHAEERGMRRRSFILGGAAGLLAAWPSLAQADLLPSWNDGAV